MSHRTVTAVLAFGVFMTGCESRSMTARIEPVAAPADQLAVESAAPDDVAPAEAPDTATDSIGRMALAPAARVEPGPEGPRWASALENLQRQAQASTAASRVGSAVRAMPDTPGTVVTRGATVTTGGR